MGKRALHRVGFCIIAAGLAVVTSGFAFFQQVGSGMIGFWRMEETATPSEDYSSAAFPGPNPATWNGGVTALAGPANTPPLLGANSTQCVNLNGTTGYLSVPGLASTNLTGDFTAAIWVYKQTDNSDWVRIMGKGASAVRTFGMWEEPGAGARILFQQYNGSGGQVLSYYSTGTIPLQQWTHVAVRMSGNNGRIFINGQPSGDGTRSGVSGNDSNPVTLGYDAMPLHSFWIGRLDDARLYNRALSDAEVAALATGSQGPAAPSNLTATPGNNTVALAWTASGATVFNVKRATVQGGPYTTIASNVATTNYADNSAVNGTTYYYVVSGVSYGEGPNSAEVVATPLPVTATPNTGLQTSEALATAPFTIKFHAPVAAGAVVQVVSNDPGEGVVSTTYPGWTAVPGGFSIDMSAAVGTTPTINVLVTGVDDQIVDPSVIYTVTVTVTNMGGYTIPDITLTNLDNDTANITFSRISGLVTSEGGGSDTFSVSLTTQPYGDIDIPLASLTPAEVTVSPASLRFTPTGFSTYDPTTGVGDWNKAHVVTVTGVDDSVLDFTIPFSIQTGAVKVYDAMGRDDVYLQATPTVTGINLDNEVIPTLPPVWGGGSGGGCGLLGPELLLPFALLSLWRRRRTGEHPSG